MIDMPNIASTGMHTILGLILNFKQHACKKWYVIDNICCYL